MAILKILKYPDKKLRLIANPVRSVNKKIQNIINDMFETMYNKQGIGLAATQVDIKLNIIVIDLMIKKYQPIVLINPKIIKKIGIIQTKESCLSIPGISKKITRAKEIKISALNYYGKKIYISAHELLAICIQHEMDHLIGKLLIDYL
ncbi:Peptide deformylase [Buchnera aphidicola (Takecallis arundicolens)]|uniref:peptide deformylase n=1 Tax=Buchnera aphidicola TaxID=9 RepID=UPI0034641F6E